MGVAVAAGGVAVLLDGTGVAVAAGSIAVAAVVGVGTVVPDCDVRTSRGPSA